MPSNLHNKINSYTLERGIEFNEPYTLTPVRTGSNVLGSYFLQNTPAPVFDANVGPIGGAGSWRFNVLNTAAPRFNTTATSELAGIDDEDWTQGFWFKMSALPTLTTSGATSGGITVFAMTPASSAAGWVANVVCTNSTTQQSAVNLAGRLTYGFTSVQIYTPVLQPETWYYIAARRVGTTMQAYFNGQLIGTTNNSALTSIPGRISFSSSSHAATNNPQIWISNFHQSTASAIDAAGIQQIYQAGITAPSVRTVKYYDGLSWQTSSAQKVWNGTAWVDWDAKRFDGTSWVTI
jgi:hypothetical protein